MTTEPTKVSAAALTKAVQTALAVDRLDLETEFARLPGDLAYATELHARALAHYLDAKHEREIAQASLLSSGAFRDAVAAGYAKPTADVIKAASVCDPRVVAARRAENVADVARRRAHGLVAAIAAKRDMVVSLGAHARLELQREPTIREPDDAENRTFVFDPSQPDDDPDQLNDDVPVYDDGVPI